MAEPSDPKDPPDPPPVAHRADDDSVSDSVGDSRFDTADERRAEAEVKRRQRTVLILVLVAVFAPFAICGLTAAVCTAWVASR